MKESQFEAAVRQFSGEVSASVGTASIGESGVAILDLTGDINSFAEEKLTTAYRQAEETNPETIVLNFTNVSYIR